MKKETKTTTKRTQKGGRQTGKLTKRKAETWQEALDQFLVLKKAQGRANSTLEDYRRFLGYFNERYPDVFNSDELKPSIIEYLSEDIKPNTYNLRRQYLKAFLTWCIKEDIIEQKNPFDDLPKRKETMREVNIDNNTVKQLLKLCDQTTWSGLRDYCLVVLTLDIGIRPSEAFALLPSDVNLVSYEIHIRDEIAKTRVSRTLPIMPFTANAIKKLIEFRHPDWNDNVPVFCTYMGTKLNKTTWADRMRVYSTQLEQKITPYMLRHIFALQSLRNGSDAFSLQRMLGHSDLSMTRRYLALTQNDLKEQHTVSSPINTFTKSQSRVKKFTKDKPKTKQIRRLG